MKYFRVSLLGVASAVLLTACGGAVPGTPQQSGTRSESASQRQASPPGEARLPRAKPGPVGVWGFNHQNRGSPRARGMGPFRPPGGVQSAFIVARFGSGRRDR